VALWSEKSSEKARFVYICIVSEIKDIRNKILLAALEQVAFDGWSWDVMNAAADEVGFSEAELRAVFPERMIGVLDYFADWADREMLAALEDVNPADMRVRDRIHEAVMARFTALYPYQEAVRQSARFWLWPSRKVRAVKITWRTADRIWDWAGDTSTDYNRYTKRGLLSGVIASTTFAWFNDADEEMR